MSATRQTTDRGAPANSDYDWPTMRRLIAWATPEHTIGFALFIGIATLACLSPAQNDTWWHLRTGQEMVRTHEWLFQDRFTFTVYGHFYWNSSWLSQPLFYALFLAGGLPLLTFFCAALIVSAWVLVWRLMRGPFSDRLILVAVALSSATVTWSVRPQAFSLLLSMLAIWLAAEDRWRPLPLLFLLWANLHAGFVMGIALLVATVLSALVVDRDRFWRRTWWTIFCAVATLVTPLALENWRQIVASMLRSRANVIQEWQPTALPPQQLAFWGLAVLLTVMVFQRWKSLGTTSDRALVMAALVAMPLAVRSLRNVPTFVMVAAPAISRLALQHRRRPDAVPRTDVSRAAVSLGLVTAVLLAGGAIVAATWRQPWPPLGWHPISPQAAAAIKECRAPIYNTYEGGGPLIWFVPSQRVFIDSRQDPFPVSLIQQATEVERTGDYRALFATWSINCAALPPWSPTVRRLIADGWTPRFRDDHWVVLDRPVPISRVATSSPAP